MNRNELVEKVSKELDYPRCDVERIVVSVLRIITEHIKVGVKVNLTGFGQFYSGLRKARVGVNPRNPAEKINVPAVKVPKFRAGKNLKDSVKHSK